jgi:A/G-specific adenine glycosylase
MVIPAFRRHLLKWFETNQRNHYPWRHTNDPYRILIAETFLQRTRADQVLPVYERFLNAFPDIKTLAKAEETRLRELMYPLGLAWRAGNLRRSALNIMERFSGEFPKTREELLEIRGVGEYVADSILYAAFNQRASIIDSNVIRVLGRLYGIDTNAESRRDMRFRQIVDSLVPKLRFRDFNLALLDLGALVCTPRNPRHDECPVRMHCIFFLETEDNHAGRSESGARRY